MFILVSLESKPEFVHGHFGVPPHGRLSESELSVMCGIGHCLLRGRIDGPQALAHVRRPRAHQQAGTSVHASAGRPGAVGVASVAEEVIDIVTNSSTCRICLYPENAEDGPLRAYGIGCSHMFHLHCITQWSWPNRTDCPVCRQPLSRSHFGPSYFGLSFLER